MSKLDVTLSEWFGVPPAAGRVAARLYSARGVVVYHEALVIAARQTRNGLNLSIKRLRDAMDEGAIVSVYRVGLRMTATGLADCDRAIADAAARERAA